MYDPEKNPYRMAKTINPAGVDTANQAKIITPLRNENGIIIL